MTHTALPHRIMQDGSETIAVTTGDFLTWTGGPVSSDSSDELIGVTLNGTYVVESILGEGGMGRVYRARHTRIPQKTVAVKVLHSEFLGNSEVLARFQREAEAAATISHPNVVALLDVDRTPRGLPYLVCEYLEGIDLSEHLRNVGRLEVVTATHIARQICRALAAAHRRGVIHRDLKPQNIFLVGDFTNGVPDRPSVKVLDFGLSRFLHADEDAQLTKTGYIMGTPAYMAPEQASGERVDTRADVYGVGAILYVCLTGRPPYEGETPQATVLQALHADPPRPRSVEPTIPPQVEILIERAISRDPRERYQGMLELERALEAIDLPMGASTVPPADTAPEPSRRTRSRSDADVEAARPRLVFFSLSAVMLLVCSAATAVTGVEYASGYTFNRVELGLFLLAVFGVSLTPALAWLSHVRKRVWDNSSRVVALLRHVRAAVLTFALTYGLGMLGLHLVDDSAVRLLGVGRVKPVGATWPGWNLVLPVAGLALAVAVVWRHHLADKMRPGIWRGLAVWSVTLCAIAAASGLFLVGVRWRAGELGKLADRLDARRLLDR